jgi:ATP-dependent RNA helicase RhlE
MNFDSLGLSAPILKAIKSKGYTKPSAIQEKAIPAVLKGRDLMAAAQTGTGKTAAFTLPILEILSKGKKVRPKHIRTLIITPTRELAAQIQDNVHMYGKHLPLTSTVVFGGVKINPQIKRLSKGVDILVATPGRLIDLHNQKAVHFDQVEVLVLDEADRMLDMGFIHDIRRILSNLPKFRQNLLFSATFSNEIRKLAKTMVNDPVEISVTPRNTTADTVKQSICPVDKKQKSALLAYLIHEGKWDQVLVFSRTKHGANRLAKQLEAKQITATAIHGNKSQGARTRALQDFKKGEVRVLVATDIAARGIDIDQLPHVINFDLPQVPEDYVHRIGRTGRAGKKGEAISLVSADEAKLLAAIERLIKRKLERRLVDGFEPDHDVPDAKLDAKPNKPRNNNNSKYKGKSSNKGGGANSPKGNKNFNRRNKKSNQQGSGGNSNRSRSGNKST